MFNASYKFIMQYDFTSDIYLHSLRQYFSLYYLKILIGENVFLVQPI